MVCCHRACLPAAGVALPRRHVFRLHSPRATRAWLEGLLPDGGRSSDSSRGCHQMRYFHLRAGRPSLAVLSPKPGTAAQTFGGHGREKNNLLLYCEHNCYQGSKLSAFVVPDRRDRWITGLDNPKHRRKILDRLCHHNDGHPRSATPCQNAPKRRRLRAARLPPRRTRAVPARSSRRTGDEGPANIWCGTS